jgi:hypothetical protein
MKVYPIILIVLFFAACSRKAKYIDEITESMKVFYSQSLYVSTIVVEPHSKTSFRIYAHLLDVKSVQKAEDLYGQADSIIAVVKRNKIIVDSTDLEYYKPYAVDMKLFNKVAKSGKSDKQLFIQYFDKRGYAKKGKYSKEEYRAVFTYFATKYYYIGSNKYTGDNILPAYNFKFSKRDSLLMRN